jgi:MscS family membrane protein
VTAVIAGLGIGGIAIALASQKSVENLLGGVMIALDQPVRLNDTCRFKNDLVGTVEDIGLRSIKVRALDRTLIAVPNAEFASIILENFSKRDKHLIKTTLGLRHETTPEQIRHVISDIKRLLQRQATVDADSARVRLLQFSLNSIDLELFAYVNTVDWNRFLEIREAIYLEVMDILTQNGTGFATNNPTASAAK